MPPTNDLQLAERMADLTYRLLENCTEKQEFIAEKLELSLSEFRCLRSFHGDKTLCVKDIAQRMNLTSSRLTRIVDGLVAKKHVTREINPIDRRVMDISLTAEGAAIVRRLNIDYVSMHEQILDAIPSAARHSVIKALDELALAMSTWMKDERIGQ